MTTTRLLLILLCTAAASLVIDGEPVDYSQFPEQLATCNGSTPLRLCDAFFGILSFICESEDTCDMTSSRELTIQFVPGEDYFIQSSVSVCRSRCRLDSDCVARFGPKSSCVQDGIAEGFIYPGSFCAERVEAPTFDCDDQNAGTIDLPIDLGAEPENPLNLTNNPDPKFGVFNVWTPCLGNTTTCACVHICTPLDEYGCAATDSITQLAYPPSNMFVDTDVWDLEVPSGTRESLCPDNELYFFNGTRRVVDGFTCSTLCANETIDEFVCPVGVAGPFCGTLWIANASMLSVPPSIYENFPFSPDDDDDEAEEFFLACYDCEEDSDCDDGNPLTLDRCLRPFPNTTYPPFINPSQTPPVQGYCVSYCETQASREAITSPQCLAGRAGFVCTSDSDCVQGLVCETEFFQVCMPPQALNCSSNLECATALNLIEAVFSPAPFGAVCLIDEGVCGFACTDTDDDCEPYYDSLSTPSSENRCVPSQNGQNVCQFRCAAQPDKKKRGGLSVGAIVGINLGILFGILFLTLIASTVAYQAQKQPTQNNSPQLDEKSYAFFHYYRKAD